MPQKNSKFVKIPRQFFQVITTVQIMDYIKFMADTQEGYKGVDGSKSFTVYALLAKDKNYFGSSKTTLKHLAGYLYGSLCTKNIASLRRTLNALKSLKLIEFDYNMERVKSTDLIEIVVNESYEGSDQYIELNEEDYVILEVAGHRAFTVYCAIKNYHRRVEGYSSISMDKLCDICRLGKQTVKTEIDTLMELGAYEKDQVGMIEFQYNASMNKVVKACNRYIPKPERVVELWQAYKRDLKQKYKIKKSEEKKR